MTTSRLPQRLLAVVALGLTVVALRGGEALLEGPEAGFVAARALQRPAPAPNPCADLAPRAECLAPAAFALASR